MNITVTQDHINKGERASCGKCPIALALCDVYPEAIRIMASPKWITVRFNDRTNNPKDVLDFRTPKEAALFIGRFDQLLPVQPFSFELQA